MHLNEGDAQLFFAVVQTFVNALPPSPKREPVEAVQRDPSRPKDRNRTKRHNAITSLRFEVQQLTVVLTKDRSLCDLADNVLDKANEALEDLLVLLEGLVDDEVPGKEQRYSTDPPLRFPRLQALEVLLRRSGVIATAGVSTRFSGEILRWIKYPAEDAEAMQYRTIVNPLQHFNTKMREIYDALIVSTELDLGQVESTQNFYEDTSDDRAAHADLQLAQKLCESTRNFAKKFAKEPCEPPHYAHIHLSGFEEGVIDMLVSVCSETKSKSHIVRWANLSLSNTSNGQLKSTGSICSVLKSCSLKRTRLRIQLQRDGYWKEDSPGIDDRVSRRAVAPKKTLEEWLHPKKYEKATQTASCKLTKKERLRLALNIARSLLCLLGSPLLQDPWKSQSIAAEVADESAVEGFKIKPYAFGKLTGCPGEEESQQSKRAKSSILHLGLLFWELFIREKITIIDEDVEDDEEEADADEMSLYNALNRNQMRLSESSFFDPLYLDLVARCLLLWGETKLDAAFRARLYWKIVRPLMVSFEVYTPNKKKLAATVQSRSARPSSPPTLGNTGFDQQQVNVTKNLGIAKKPATIMSTHKECVLFDVDAQTYQEGRGPDYNTEDFVDRMTTFIRHSILPLPYNFADQIMLESQKSSIDIAVLDTGVHIDEEDELLKGGRERIIRRRNFLGEDKDAWKDIYGHGTHVVRLLLRFAPFARIIVAKISESKKLTGTNQIIDALDWVTGPDCNAKIIVMSFGLGRTPDRKLQSRIRALVNEDKLIFAAASNGGGNEPRAFPATEKGVFCINVSDGKGNKTGINPAPVDDDNFSTLGSAIDSKWEGKDVYINGSSFATPVAAAIAANALEFIRHRLTNQRDRPEYFYTYQGMTALFRCLSDDIDGYDYVKPWKRYLWDNETKSSGICSALRAIRTYGPKEWIKMTSESSFPGFEEYDFSTENL